VPVGGREDPCILVGGEVNRWAPGGR
jgi:hypothetical protein